MNNGRQSTTILADKRMIGQTLRAELSSERWEVVESLEAISHMSVV